MGLELIKQQESGVDVQYWKIISIKLNRFVDAQYHTIIHNTKMNSITIELAGYISKDARDNNKSPIIIDNLTLQISDEEYKLLFIDELRPFAYSCIMQLPEWLESKNV